MESLVLEIMQAKMNLMTTNELAAFLSKTEDVIRELENGGNIIVETANLDEGGLEVLRAKHFRKFNGLTKKLEKKEISIDTYNKKSHDLFATTFRKAYEENRGAKLTPGDEEYIRRAVDAEMGYARKFGNDIVNDNLKMPRVERAAMYSQTLNGIAWHAKVEEQPDNVQIDWVLGHAEHCPDCIILAANSPYSKWNLPTTPKAGATQCLTNCECKLRFKKARFTDEELDDAEAYTKVKDQPLNEFTSQPKPPFGMRKATIIEQVDIDDLRSEINFNRRRIAQAGLSEKELETAVRLRKEANAELIEYLEENDIYEVPLWSVDDVLDGRHISETTINDIFRDGIDGKSLGKIAKDKIDGLVGKYKKAADEKKTKRPKKKKKRKKKDG